MGGSEVNDHTSKPGKVRMTHDEARLAVLDAAREAISREAGGIAALSAQLDDSFLDVVEMLYRCKGKVFVTGAGTSGAVARRMAHLFSVCGTPSIFIQSADALHGTMGAITPGDLLIAISRGGGSAEINEFAKRAQDRGAEIIALTSRADSELARVAETVAVVESPLGIDPGEVVAMGSALIASAWGDAMAYVLMRMRGYTWDAVLHSHPSGAVGQLRDAPPAMAPLPAEWAEATHA